MKPLNIIDRRAPDPETVRLREQVVALTAQNESQRNSISALNAIYDNLEQDYFKVVEVVKERDLYRKVLAFHPRAAKLMERHKPFLVVAVDELYFASVYCMIWSEEKRKGTWTDEDQALADELMRQNDMALAAATKGASA